MKKTIFSVPSLWVLGLMFLGGCGGQQAETVPAPTPAENLDKAQATLISGDVSGAKKAYDDLVKSDPKNTNAAFGAALSRLLLLGEGQPAQDFLKNFSQTPVKGSSLVGPKSYLAELDEISKKEPGSGRLPVAGNHLPFAVDEKRHSGSLGRLRDRVASKAIAGLKIEELQNRLADLLPFLDEIESNLQKADQSDDFQFVIPKALYFGEKDIPLNRLDLKAMRAGLQCWVAAIHFFNAWDLPLELGGLFDVKGDLVRNKKALVAELNRFFTLRPNHRLDQAKRAIEAALRHWTDAIDLLSKVSKDGVFENDPVLTAAYDELKALSAVVQKSLGGPETFSFVNPSVTLNMSQFFDRPPDARTISSVPFVLEEGQIRPVETFFKEMMTGILDLKFKRGLYNSAIKSIDRAATRKIFDEFVTFVVAGRTVGGGSSSGGSSAEVPVSGARGK